MSDLINMIKEFLAHLQGYARLICQVLRNIGSVRMYKRETMDEMYRIGTQSLPLVVLGGVFTGIILALETGYRFVDFGAKTITGYTVILGVVRELGPLVAGLLLASRTGAKNVSEIGAMQLSEQIDALRANGEDPIRCLVVPRTVASVIMFLPLTALVDAGGILGGMYAAATSLHIDPSMFWNTGITGLRLKDLFVGFSKPMFFGFFIATVSSYFGLSTSGGTTGLGRSTINAVVNAALLVLALDFVFTKLVWELM